MSYVRNIIFSTLTNYIGITKYHKNKILNEDKPSLLESSLFFDLHKLLGKKGKNFLVNLKNQNNVLNHLSSVYQVMSKKVQGNQIYPMLGFV